MTIPAVLIGLTLVGGAIVAVILWPKAEGYRDAH